MLAGALLAALVASAPAQMQLVMDVGGPVVPHAVNGQTEWVYQWPGIYFEGRFRGDSVTLHMDDANNWFDVLVDGKALMVLQRPGKTMVSLENLGAGEHVIRLEKRTETQSATGAFGGFFVARKEDALIPRVRVRKMIFLGDSLTVGYGNTSQFSKCSKDEVFESTNTSEAFAPLVAKHFDAEYEVRAFSGLGLVRNYGGVEYPQYHLPSLWQRAIFEDAQSHAGEWDPQVLVIGIGGNDFSTHVIASEKWKTQEEMAAEYAMTYVAFLKKLRETYPHTLIVMTWTSDFTALYTQTAAKVFAQAQAEGMGNIDHLEFPKMDRTGCNGHPNVRDDAKVAELLETVIARHADAWQGK
jgi:lysophospholipase L1-like esterase